MSKGGCRPGACVLSDGSGFLVDKTGGEGLDNYEFCCFVGKRCEKVEHEK